VIAFRQRHPHRVRLISTILGWGDLGSDDAVCQFVGNHPFVAFRPASVAAPTQARPTGSGATVTADFTESPSTDQPTIEHIEATR
jgi:hypothetical protein